MLNPDVPAGRIKRSRASYLDLLDGYRQAAERTWNDIDAATGVVPSTREQWFNGKTQNVPLVGIIRIAAELDVPPEKLFSAVLEEDELYVVGIERRAHLETRLRALEETVSSLDEVRLARQIREDAERSLGAVKGLVHQAEDRPDAEGDTSNPG